MPEYPSNSYASKNPKPAEEKPKVEKVIVGGVTRRKQSLGAKFKQTFIGGDANSVVNYILTDIVIPTFKALILDVGSQGLERTLYGDTRPNAHRSAMTRLGATAYTAYHRASQQNQAPRPDPRAVANRAHTKSYMAWEDIVLDTRVEAEAVIDKLVELIGKYEQASVTELYDMIDIKAEYTDNLWGWRDIRGMGVQYIRGGYLLQLPPPEVLKEA
jgi:hypothetical protein